GLRPYWINTSDNRLVRDVMQMDKQESRKVVESLLKKEEVRKEVILNIAYPQIASSQDTAWSFLLHGGYLKASERRQIHRNITYNLSIPNLEVETIYETIIKSWLEEDLEANEDFLTFIAGIRELNPVMIEDGLGGILFALASFHDTAFPRGARNGHARSGNARSAQRKAGETFYHGLMLGLLAYLSSEYIVESNREYGSGRADIVLIKRNFGRDTTPGEVLLFELKQQPIDSNSPLEELAGEALTQARERYLAGLKKKWQPERYLVVGAGFSGREMACQCEQG
ncbi:MAG: hypothetical protein B0D92_02300, partial [Spirochaeta sp. LUC14_002_19_P3]